MRSVTALALCLALVSLTRAAGADNLVSPIACSNAGVIIGQGHVRLSPKGNLSGSLTLLEPMSYRDVGFLCSLSCGALPMILSRPCGTMRGGQRVLRVHAKGFARDVYCPEPTISLRDTFSGMLDCHPQYDEMRP